MIDRYRLTLVLSAILLFGMGLLMVFNTTAAEVLNRSLDQSTHYALLRQLLFALLGLFGALVCWMVGYERMLQISGLLLAVTTLFLILVFIPKIGHIVNGAYRWVRIFGFSFQPSELAKYLIPLYFIQVMTSDKRPDSFIAFVKFLGLFLVPIGLIFMEPDNGTVVIIFATLIVLFILTRIPLKYWLLPLLVVSLCMVPVAMHMKHVSDRIRIYLNPELDLQGKGHQPHQAKIATGSGGLWGKGMGKSLQKLDYLPEARSDYIAAIFAEENGFIGILLLIVLYLLMAGAGFFLATRTEDLKAFYLISIFTFLICFQAFLNLGVVSGLLPSKGTNLPFFSHGGSSLFVNLNALALILQASRQQMQKEIKG